MYFGLNAECFATITKSIASKKYCGLNAECFVTITKSIASKNYSLTILFYNAFGRDGKRVVCTSSISMISDFCG